MDVVDHKLHLLLSAATTLAKLSLSPEAGVINLARAPH
jgi:hypothetical protein